MILTFMILMISAAMASAQPYRMMSWQEYSSYSHSWPYIMMIYTHEGGLLYFGVNHSHNPQNDQFYEIDALWKQFKPEIAFNEGNTPPLERSRNRAIRKYGEPGIVTYLAARDHVSLESIDSEPAKEVAELGKTFRPEQLALFYVLRQKLEYNRIPSPKPSLRDYLQGWIKSYNEVAGLNIPPSSFAELQSTYSQIFPGRGSLMNASDSSVDPTQAGSILNEISRASVEYRDQFMVAQISRAVLNGKRVFAVVGATHVVMQESAIRMLLTENAPTSER